MKLTLSNKGYLGLAVSERSILVAELVSSAAGPQVRKMAEFVTPAGENGAALALDASATVEAFGKFLREHRFSASRAVVGIPAKWLLAKERELPPSSPQQAADILRLQAERLFSAELKDLVYDFAGEPDANAPSRVLVAAAPRLRLDPVLRLSESAGLSVEGIMPSILALSGAAEGQAGDGIVLNVGRDSAEMSVSAGASPRLMRYLPVRGPDPASQNGTRSGAVNALAGEVKRAIALMPLGRASTSSLTIWDGVGLRPEESSSLGDQVGASVRTITDFSLMGVLVGADANDGDLSRYAPAVALALAGARLGGRMPLAINFLKPRLAAPKEQRVGRRTVWGMALGVTLVIVVASLLVDLHLKQKDLEQLTTRLTQMGPEIKSAEALSEKITIARGWFEARPPMLECLREVTMEFGVNDPMYVTNFNLGENRKGQIAGRSSEQRSVLNLLDKLKNNRSFADVKLLEMRDAGNNSREVHFRLSFTFVRLQ